MRRTTDPIGQSGALADENDLHAVVAAIELGLLDRPQSGEGRITANHRQLAAGCETRGDARHVLLGDPHIEEAFGISLGEVEHSRRMHEIRRQSDQIGSLGRERQHGLAELLPDDLGRKTGAPLMNELDQAHLDHMLVHSSLPEALPSRGRIDPCPSHLRASYGRSP
jgi:hypothetical protein